MTVSTGETFQTSIYTGAINCGASSPDYTASTINAASRFRHEIDPYVFQAYVESDDSFPVCGFKEYSISAVSNGAAVTVTYPPTGTDPASCTTLTSCLSFNIDTTVVRDITFTI